MSLSPSFEGNRFTPGAPGYDRHNNIYSYTSCGKERDLHPAEILQPTSIKDIQDVVKYANETGKPIAIRSGGHQYSGASSTGPKGIQLDLKPTFRRPKLDLHLIRDAEKDKVYVKTSVSWTLTEFFDFLLDNGVFLPTGQCSTVCLGGHAQTGGYGMLARSFGILADYIVELHIVDHKGDVLMVTKENNPDLFFGFLGGSPGNLGILTHIKVEVQEDRKHQNSKGMWLAFHYNQQTLNALLDILVERGQDPNWERNYDYGVNIISRQADLSEWYPGSDEELKKKLPDYVHDGVKNIADLKKFKYALIVVYAQWVNFGGKEVYSPDFFDRLKKVDKPFLLKESPPSCPMSKITSFWLFQGNREFPLPYVKRTNTTKSTTLDKDGWSDWFAGRMNEILKDTGNGMWISSQLQAMGGINSMIRKNTGNGTAYSWRDSTVSGTWDVFYQDETKATAEAWQKENDAGSLARFSKVDLRLLWGSYGDWNMKNVWQTYHEPATYKRLQQIRKKADPKGIFTANPFCVEAAP